MTQQNVDHANDIWIYYQNVRGLRTKIDDLFLATTDCNYDVVIMTETGLDDRIYSQQLFSPNFNVYRCDRSPENSNKSRLGGVLVAIAQQYASRAVHTVNGRSLEQVCVSATIKGRMVSFCAVYIPPDKSQDVATINEHLYSVQELCNSSADGDAILVCGDYNQPRMHWCLNENEIRCDGSQLPFASGTLLDGMDYLCLVQRNLVPNHLDRILDLVFCSPDCNADVSRCSSPWLPVDSYHPPLAISLPAGEVCSEPIPRHQERPLNYRRINYTALSDYLFTVDWNAHFVSGDVDEMADRFCSVLNDWFTANVPRIQPRASPAWSTNRLRVLKRARNALQRKLRRQRSDSNKRNFHQASNAYRHLNATLYKSYVLRIQFSLRRNPRGFWRFVNSKRTTAIIPSNVYLNDSSATSVSSSCELFAKHFASVFATNSTSRSETEHAASDVPVDTVDLGMFEISPETVTSAANKLKCSFAPGPDGLPAAVICRCVGALAEPLSRVFNRSFEQAKFPRIWKQSFMTPVFKRGDRHNVTDYRGITSLSAVSKLFEIIVCGFVFDSTKSYISFDQHGFMPGRSVTTNLLNFTSKCITSMEEKAQVDVVYTDLKAAFDKIDHAILLHKLSRLGFSTQLVSWFDSYLTGRVLRVKLDGCVSSQFSNNSGVPQGSNLGPLLFILFFNDATLILDHGCKLVYADDLKLYLEVRSREDCYRLQNMLNMFAEWCQRNKLTISIGKCQVITFHRKINPVLFDYQIDGVTLNRVSHVTDLGVQLDSKMTFDLHRSAIISRATRQLGFISKLAKDFSDPHCWKSLYCALVRPLMENASVVWHPYQVTWSLRIERVQKRFIRLALRDLPWRDPNNLPPYPDRCRLLGLDTLECRRKRQQALVIAKLLNGETDDPELLSLLNFRVPSRSFRSTALLQPRFHRTLFGYNEPITACIRTFTTVEDHFEFNETATRFLNRIRNAF